MAPPAFPDGTIHSSRTAFCTDRTPGLHTLRRTVEFQPRETLLPPDLSARFLNDAFWRDPQRIPAGLQVV